MIDTLITLGIIVAFIALIYWGSNRFTRDDDWPEGYA